MDRSDASGSLAHYGIKGMKWGVRRSDAELERARPAPRPRLSEDARNAERLHTKIQTKGTGSLSNQEMRQYLERMDLERRFYSTISPASPQQQAAIDRGLQQTQKILKVGKTVEEVRKFLNTPTGQAVKTGVMTAAAAAAAYATGGASSAAATGVSVVLRNRQRNHYTNVGN